MSDPSATPSLIFEAVSKVFFQRVSTFAWFSREPRLSTLALEGVSLRLPKAHTLVLLGPNGSGKTTALKLVSTMLLPDSGRVLVHRIDTACDSNEVRKHVGFAVASERSFFPRLSAYENLDFFATMDDVPKAVRPHRIKSVLKQVELSDARDKQVMRFSSGMYQRLAIARALCKQPSILLLDEPTRSLDPASASHLLSLVRDLSLRGTSIVMASHSFTETAQVADSVAVLHSGKIAGQRSMHGISANSLRSFYFDCTNQSNHMPEIAEALAG